MEAPPDAPPTTTNMKYSMSDDDISLVDDYEVPLPDRGYDSGQDEEDETERGNGHHDHHRKTMEAEERKSLSANKEQKAVSFLRVAVYLVVVVTAVIVSVGVYFYAKKQEQDNFNNVFETNPNKLAGTSTMVSQLSYPIRL